MTVLAPERGPFREVGERIAERRGERLVSDLEAADDDGTVVYVDGIDEVDERTLLALQRRMQERGPVEGGFSVVTGPNPNAAYEFYDRETAYDDEHAIFRWHDRGALDVDDSTSVLSGQDLTASNAADILDGGVTSLSMHAHGWPIHLHLREGYICGYPDDPEEWSFDGDQPHCVRDGERDCPFDEELLSAHDLDVSHLFLRNCASTINNNTSSLPVHASMGLMGNAESVVGPYRTNMGYPHEVPLHYSLLRAGYDVRERCYLLNANASVNASSYLPYIPMGSPDAGVDSAGGDDPEVEVRTDGTDPAVLRVEDVDGYVIDVSVSASELPPADDRYYLRRTDGGDDDTRIYYVAFEEGDRVRVVCYSGARMEYDAISFELADEPVEADRREIARRSLHNAERLANFDLLTSKASKQLDGLWHQVRNLPEEVESERYDVDAHRESREKIHEPFGNVDAIRDQLLSTLSRGERLHNHYGNRAVDDRVYQSDEPCPYCDRPVVVKHVSDGDRTERAIGICPSCGYVYDVPADGRSPALQYPVVEAAVEESPSEITVAMENPTDASQRVTVFPVVLDVGDEFRDRGVFEPRYAELNVDADERIEATFGVDLELLDANQHYVLGHVVGNLELYSGTRPLVVGGRPGRRHRRYSRYD